MMRRLAYESNMGRRRSRVQLRLVLAIVVVLATAQPSGAAPPKVERIGGADRYETAVGVVLRAHHDWCAENWETSHASEQQCRDEGDLGTWTLARGDSFADALSAASVLLGPVLITPRDRLPPALDPLAGRLSSQATIIGEEDVISEAVEFALVPRFARGTSRYAGSTRYDTAVAVARLHRDGYGEGFLPFFEVMVVNGERWPDALAAGGLTDIMRIVLPTQQDRLPPVVADYLAETTGAGSTITVIGGTDAVSDDVISQIATVTPATIRRVGGRDRFETARAVADVYLAERRGRTDADAGSPYGVVLVRPDTFADAIAAPNIIRTRRAPILLAASRTELGDDNAAWLEGHAAQLGTVTGLGTSEVLADAVLAQAGDAICAGRDDCW